MDINENIDSEENFYNATKTILKDKFKLSIVEGDFKLDFKPNFIKSRVEMKQTLGIDDKIHWSLGLLISSYCNKNKIKLHMDDYNSVAQNLHIKYMKYEYDDIKTKNESQFEKVFNHLDILFGRLIDKA